MPSFAARVHCLWCEWQSVMFTAFGDTPFDVIAATLEHARSVHVAEYELALLEHGIDP